jgi:hypothetical protein
MGRNPGFKLTLEQRNRMSEAKIKVAEEWNRTHPKGDKWGQRAGKANKGRVKFVGCSYDGCERKHWAKKMCTLHYDRIYRKIKNEKKYDKFC